MAAILTKKLLEQLNFISYKSIYMCERYELFGFPLDRLDEIAGDYDGLIRQLRRLKNLDIDLNQLKARGSNNYGMKLVTNFGK